MTLGDFNVPVGLPGHALTIGLEPAWIIQRQVAGSNFTGVQPTKTIASVPTLQPPVVGAGSSIYDALTDGGLFTMQQCGKSIVVEGSYSKNGTFTSVIVVAATGAQRTMPTTFPFKMAPGEMIKSSCTGNSGITLAEIGFCVRLSAEELL